MSAVSRNALDALREARAAWERTQPQLVIDGWAAGLEEADGLGSPVRLLEPASSPPGTSPRGGLHPCGTEPRHAAVTDGKPVAGVRTPRSSSSGVVVGAAPSASAEEQA